MAEYRNVFIRYLRSQGLKMTRSREAIMDAVFATHSHFDVEDIYQHLCKARKLVSRATIYRTIPYLLAAGLIRRSMCQDHKEEYEHIYGHPRHLHLLCISCGKILEQADNDLEKILFRIARNNGFTLEDYVVSLKGLCSDCRRDSNQDKDKGMQ
jgi:Fur family ferric uptake transcriptional regulator